MGSQAVPLSAEEYRKRYVRQHVPHVCISNPDEESIRVHVTADSGAIVASVLLLPRELVHLPAVPGYRFQFTPRSYSHAQAT